MIEWTLKLDVLEARYGKGARWRLRDSAGELQGSWPHDGDFELVLRRSLRTFERATGQAGVARVDDSISRAKSWVIQEENFRG